MMKEDIKELQKLSNHVDADEEGYFYRYLPNLLKTDQHCSLKSFKEWVQKGLVPEILKHFLKVLKENKL
jgi:hypothetical protein